MFLHVCASVSLLQPLAWSGPISITALFGWAKKMVCSATAMHQSSIFSSIYSLTSSHTFPTFTSICPLIHHHHHHHCLTSVQEIISIPDVYSCSACPAVTIPIIPRLISLQFSTWLPCSSSSSDFTAVCAQHLNMSDLIAWHESKSYRDCSRGAHVSMHCVD